MYTNFCRSMRVNIETILSHTEPMRKRFHRWPSQRRANFRVRSGSDQILTDFSMISDQTLPVRNEFHRCLSQRETNFIAYWFKTETNLTADWVNVETIYRWLSLNSELGIYELLTAFI